MCGRESEIKGVLVRDKRCVGEREIKGVWSRKRERRRGRGREIKGVCKREREICWILITRFNTHLLPVGGENQSIFN